MRTLRIAIAGATGRMGTALLRLASADARFAVVAALTQPGDAHLGQDAFRLAGIDAPGPPLREHCDAPCDVLVEFSAPGGCVQWANWCAAQGVGLVSGTTGLNPQHHAVLRDAATRVPVLWSANTSVGVNVLLGLVEQAARALAAGWDIEIVESHHRHKADAPSGTAKALLESACRGRGWSPEAVAINGRSGQTGARPAEQIGIHAVRLGEVVGTHEVHLAGAAEIVTLSHRALSRDTFAAGALRAAVWLHGRPAGLYGMRDVLAQ